MAEKHKTIYMKQDRFVKKSLFSQKTIMCDQVLSIDIDCGDGVSSKEAYTFHMSSGEQIHFTKEDMTEDSVSVLKFGSLNKIPYQCSQLSSLTYTPAFDVVQNRMNTVLVQYQEYGQQLVQSKFGADCNFVIEPKFKEYFWRINYYVEKNGQRIKELGTMSLGYLYVFDPAAGKYEYAMTAELANEEEGKETIRDDIAACE